MVGTGGKSLRLAVGVTLSALLTLAAAAVQPAKAQILDLPLDLSLLDLDGTLEQTLESLTPTVAAITGCSPAECTNILTTLAGQTAQSQQVVASALSSATLQSSQQLSDFALSTTVYEGAIAGFSNAAAMRSLTPTVATFGISGVAFTDHDGFDMTAGGVNIGKSPDFDSTDAGATLGLRFDGSRAFNLPRETLTFGVFGNYTNTDIDFGSNRVLRELGVRHAGDASLDSGSAGGYGLLTNGKLYGLALGSGQFGEASVHDAVTGSHSSFDTSGFSGMLAGGTVMPAWGTTKVDLRGGLNYYSIETDRHTDSVGLTYGEGEIEAFSGTLSSRFFTTMVRGTTILRPFLQAGVDYRFDYDNEIRVEGVKFSFDESPTTVFGRVGVDFEVGQYTQAFVAVRGDHNDDFDAVAAQVGLTLRLN